LRGQPILVFASDRLVFVSLNAHQPARKSIPLWRAPDAGALCSSIE
jgi:hypothetical protein